MPAQKPKFDPNHFHTPPMFTLIVNIPLIPFFVFVCFCPDSVPGYLWPFNIAVQWWAQNLYGLGVFALAFIAITHVVQSSYAVKLCLDHGMTASATLKWFLMAMYCGYFCLVRELIPYLQQFKKD